MLADKKRMLLPECLQKCSHREYLSWMYFYSEKWKELDLTHYYLMQISQRILQSVSKNPNNHKLKDQKIPFKYEKEESQMSVDEITAMAKSSWGARLKSAGVEYKITKAENK